MAKVHLRESLIHFHPKTSPMTDELGQLLAAAQGAAYDGGNLRQGIQDLMGLCTEALRKSEIRAAIADTL